MSYRQTDRRLAEAPLDILAAAAATTLGSGNQATLIIAAAAKAGGAEARRRSRQALAPLLQDHKDRLLRAVNAALAAAGRPTV